MASQPIDQASILAGGRALVPDFLQQQLQQSLGNAQVQQANAQTNLFKQKAAESLVATREQEEYSREVQEALDSGDPQAISRLIARFPAQKDALKTHYDQMDVFKQRSELRQAAGIWSALNAGNTDAAIKSLETRITSDREAGEDTADDEEQLSLLKSGDPKAVNSVKGRLGLFMASVVPDKFASVVEQVGAGNNARKGTVVGRAIGHYNDAGQWVTDYRDPEDVKLSEGQTLFRETPGAGAGAPPSPGFDSFYSGFLAPVEGGYVAKDGKSGAPANYGVNQAANPDIDVANLTPEQAKRIMQERYWTPSGADQIGDPRLQAIHADSAVNMGVGRAKQLLQQSGGDPSRYLALREQFYRQLGGPDLEGWLNRNQKLAQYTGLAGGGAGGGMQPVASVPKSPTSVPQGTRMTPDENAAEGLPRDVVYYRNKYGVPEPVGGQARPVAGQKDGAYSQSAIDAFDRAIDTAGRLKAHPGLSAAVGVKGLSGGFLGGWVVPGTDAADFGAELDAMKAQVFLPMVQSMKGMGALSNAEGEKLTAAIGALSTKQSEKQFTSSLNRIMADLNTYKKRGMAAGGGATGAPVQVRSLQQARALPPGTVFIDPNGVRRVR